MVDYEKINDSGVKVVPDHPVIYLSGPMSNCKSDPSLDHSDFNYPAFDKLDDYFTAQGIEVLNPVKTEHMVRNENGLPSGDPRVWQACLKKDLLSMIEAGVTEVVFIPPAHTVNSTPESPEFRTWQDSSGACIEAMFAYKLGLEFGQIVPQQDGSYTIEKVDREEVRDILAHSQTLKDLQKDYTGPAINQGAQALDAKPKGEAVTAAASTAEHHVMPAEHAESGESVSHKA